MVPGFLSELEWVDGEEDGCLSVVWVVGLDRVVAVDKVATVDKIATVDKTEPVIELNKVAQPIAERGLNSELAEFLEMTHCLLARV